MKEIENCPKCGWSTWLKPHRKGAWCGHCGIAIPFRGRAFRPGWRTRMLAGSVIAMFMASFMAAGLLMTYLYSLAMEIPFLPLSISKTILTHMPGFIVALFLAHKKMRAVNRFSDNLLINRTFARIGRGRRGRAWSIRGLVRRGLSLLLIISCATILIVTSSSLTAGFFPFNAFILIPLGLILGYFIIPVYCRLAGIRRESGAK